MTTTSLRRPGRAVTPHPSQPSWPWWAALGGLVLTALLLRTWGAAANNGVGNPYYTATALAMSQDWTAFLTGGFDTGGFITMDKPAVWLWPSAALMALFVPSWFAVFGPTLLAGTASVVVLALIVRENAPPGRAGQAIALLAALGLAISPVNVAADRVNNADPMMLLALLLAAWATLRAVRTGRIPTLALAGVAVGLAFQAKYLQAYVVLPALTLVWLLCASVPVARRLLGLGAAGLALVATSASWPLLASVVASANGVWMGSSFDGSVLGRLVAIVFINLAPPQMSGPGAEIVRGFQTGQVFHAGLPGPDRLLTGVLADQASWWLPAAVLGAVAVLVLRARRPRRLADPAVAGVVLWSAWTVICCVVFSFQGGVLHPYYTSMLVPALAALTAAGIGCAWTGWRLGSRTATVLLAAQVLLVAGWAVAVLVGTSGGHPAWLPAVVGVAAVAAVAVVAGAGASTGGRRAVATLGIVAALAAPLVWSLRTTSTPTLPGNPLANQEGRYELTALPPPVAAGVTMMIAGFPVDPGLVGHLRAERGDARWIVATLTAMQAAPLQIAAGGEPVMALGGFDGNDPTPTPDVFRAAVAAGEIRFVLVDPPGAGAAFVRGPAAEVLAWVATACRPSGVSTGGPQVLLDCAGAT